MKTQKFFVRITHAPEDKNDLIHLIPGLGVAHRDDLAEYWVKEKDKSTIWNNMKETFKEADKEKLFEKIKIEIMDISENGYVRPS